MDILLYAVVSAWLLILAFLDVRKGEISNWLTLTMVVAAVLDACAQSRSIVPLVIAFTMLILLEVPIPWWGFLPVIGSLLIVLPAWQTMTLGWGVAVSLWKAGAIGGADAKVMMALTALIPDMRLLLLVLICWALFDLIRMIFRRRARRQAALLPVFATGGTIYFLVMLFAWTSGSAVLPWRFP